VPSSTQARRRDLRLLRLALHARLPSLAHVRLSLRLLRSAPLRGAPVSRSVPRCVTASSDAAGPRPGPDGEYSSTLERFTEVLGAEWRREARPSPPSAGHDSAPPRSRRPPRACGRRGTRRRRGAPRGKQRGGDRDHELEVLGSQAVGDLDGAPRGSRPGSARRPWVAQARRRRSGAAAARRAARPAPSPTRGGVSAGASVISTARAIGSCSAWASRSAAIQSGSAAASATDDDPRSAPPIMSMPTSPKTRVLASAT